MVPYAWLEAFNRKCSDQDIAYRTRPFLALRAWSLENTIAVGLNSETSKQIFDWFYRNSPPESHHLGPLYTGIFYYDVYFWPIDVPIAYGTITLDAFDALTTMPDPVKERLRGDVPTGIEYYACWADCVDYALGRDDIRKQSGLSEFAGQLFTAADAQLTATVTLLRERSPNSKAMETARMATEIFLKAYLASHVGLTEQAARKLSHNLEEAVQECGKVSSTSEMRNLSGRVTAFPAVGSRYEGRIHPLGELWYAYGTAQFAASAFARSLTDRGMRDTIEASLRSVAQENRRA
jgi:hypothetical protein